MAKKRQAPGTLKRLGEELMRSGFSDQKCSIHGTMLYRFDDGRTICEKCEEEKQASRNRDEEMKIAEEKRKSMAEELLASLGLPRRLSRHSFDNFKTSDKKQSMIKAAVQDYAASFGPESGGLLMIGSVGTGKTHLASALCMELVPKLFACHFTGINRIIRSVRSSWGGRSEKTEQQVIDEYSAYDLLVIDEIGSQYCTDSERIIVNEIINDRYEDSRPTVIIGNVNISEAKEILGERVVSRLSENGSVLVFNWESHRRLKDQQKRI